jgi:hypothetical protein
VTDTNVTDCAASSMPHPAVAAAAAATRRGGKREHSAGPSFATATVNATVVTENTHDSTPRFTPSACSKGTRKHDQQYTLPSNTFSAIAPKKARRSFSVSKRGANRARLPPLEFFSSSSRKRRRRSSTPGPSSVS